MQPRFEPQFAQVTYETLLRTAGAMDPTHFSPMRDDVSLASPASRCKVELDKMTNPRSQLKTGERAAGYWLEGKVCKPAFQHGRTGITACLELDANTWILLEVYNMFGGSGTKLHKDDLAALLPLGSTVKIREPYLKLLHGLFVHLRIDNPADITVVSNVLPKQLNVNNEMREKGNAYFKQKLYFAAKLWYLQCCDEDYKAASNLAQVEFALGNFISAYTLSRKVLLQEPGNVKCQYRCGMCCMELGLFQEANEYFTQAKALDLARIAQMCQKQQDTGMYDWDALYAGKHASKYTGTFIGPIAIESRKGYGRCLVAKQDIKRGQLLLVESPMLLQQVDISAMAASNQTPEYMQQAAFLDFLANVCQRCMDDKHLLRQLSLLSDGVQQEDSMPVPRVEVRRGIIDEEEVLQLDVSRIREAIKRNAFGGHDGVHMDLNSHRFDLRFFHSFANHDCCANTFKVFPGMHAQGLRASRDIKRGEMITLMYIDGHRLDLAQRQTQLKEWGFTCQCKSCVLEAKLDLRALHNTLDLEVQCSMKHQNDPKWLLSSCNRMLLAIKQAGVEHTDLWHRFLDPYLTLCRLAETMQDVDLALRAHSMVIAVLEHSAFDIATLCYESAQHLKFALLSAHHCVEGKREYSETVHQWRYGKLTNPLDAVNASMDEYDKILNM